jgi:hypothetical protein
MAAFDWQIGAFAVLGACAAALLMPAADRVHASARVALGAAAAALPVVAAYAWRGGLGALWSQTVVSSFFRGAATREVATGPGEWARRWQVAASGTEGHTWLLALAALGVPAYAAWLRTPRGRALRPLGAALGVHHFGVLGFSLWDFQVYGDLFALLHTACFFAALAAGEAWLRIAGRLGPARRGIAAAVAALACLAIARPWVDRGALRVPGVPAPDVTVETQRAVTARLAPLLAQPGTAVRGASEQLFLSGQRNPLPFVVWNPAVYSYFRQGPAEDRAAALARLEETAGVTHLVCEHASLRCAGRPSYRLVQTVGDPARYAVDVYERLPPTDTRPSPRSPAP